MVMLEYEFFLKKRIVGKKNKTTYIYTEKECL